MEISKKTDNSKLRVQSMKKNIPITDLLVKKIDDISKKEKIGHTLLAVCPNSENVLKAALRSAKRASSPIKFAATLNQVDIDGGYTGWKQNDLVRIIKQESYRIGYNGPIIIAVDHGGPWVKDIQTIEKWNLKKSITWIKESFKAAILAGYDLIHVDPTVDIFNQNIKIETVIERTIELISHCEDFRKNKKLAPISYEVGTEEVHGGLSNLDTFKKFLKLLKKGLKTQNLEYIWPIFIVAKVGTNLHTTDFDSNIAKEVVNIASNFHSFIKGHYTDFVTNPEDYPSSGIGAANVGPEFTIVEYNALNELYEIEKKLYKQNKIAYQSKYKEKLTNAVLESERWKKWLIGNEKDFNSLSENRKNWVLKTSCRYVWANPEVRYSQILLYNNLKLNGIDAENWVIRKIEASIDKYLREFNLINLNEKISNLSVE